MSWDQRERVGRKGWGVEAISIAIIIQWLNPWPLASALEGLLKRPVAMERRVDTTRCSPGASQAIFPLLAKSPKAL